MSLLPRPTVIFSGSMWPQQHNWQNTMHCLPANACLLAVDPKNKKLTQIMHRVAQAFADKGRPVHFWITPAP